MKLYSFPGSCGLVSNIVLEWAGEPYTVELLKKEDLHQPAYLKINPNGQVPVIDEDGWILNENAAVLSYIADKHPQAKLDGDGTPRGRAEVNRWLGMLNSDVHPAFKPLFGSTDFLGDEKLIAKSHAVALDRLRGLFGIIDKHLTGRDWLAGTTRSIADPYLFVVLTWAHFVKVDLTGYENLKRFEAKMRTDAGVQKALKAQGLEKGH
ncbi:MAG: glutathione S-transferase family protein [Rhodanobacter sp.]|nr:MAG: glutathione S-transferase family protein [Rhodanobacter sp.]TAM15164.1 MAG: glutathione S-transferase family protein [Rhodanobacter sp.]TAM36366.1 MAG: glutathione S-transferase family protein [Rhodanobacter sp.]